MAEVFLSYSREDQELARRYAAALESAGLSVWWDQALNPGETFDQITEQRLRDAKAVVVLWSRKSVASRWVRSEATLADRYGKLVPVAIEACDRPIQFELSHTADLSGWNGDTSDPRWRALLDGIRRLASGSDAQNAPAPRVSAPSTSPHGNRTLLAVAAVAVLMVIAAGIAYWRMKGAPKPTASAAPSIAVMPFDDLSAGKDQAYFADGVAEQIIESLSRIPGNQLKVIARTSSFALRGSGGDLRSIRNTLGVNHLLTGSVRKAGDQVRVNAQLVNTADGTTRWTREYTQPLNDIFRIQEDIARSVGEALQVSLGVGMGQRPGLTRDVDAYDLYLSGLALVWDFEVEHQRRAISKLEQAVARDPEFAVAWALLSEAYQGMVPLSPGEASHWTAKSDEAFENVERLLPDAEMTLTNRAGRNATRGRLVEAGKVFAILKTQKALHSGTPYGYFLLTVGRVREALEPLHKEMDRDPLNTDAAFLLIHAYGNSGNAAAGLAEAERTYKLNGPTASLIAPAAITLAQGIRDSAQIARWVARDADRNPDSRAVDAQIASLLDRPGELRKWFQARAKEEDLASVSHLQRAVWLAYLDDPRGALEATRRAYDSGLVAPALLSLAYPQMQAVRRLPEFKEFIRSTELLDYWRQFGWSDYCHPVGKDDFECN